MVDVFTIVIKKLQEMGAFNFLFPFMLTTAIFYGLLRKSKLFSVTKKEYRRDKGGKQMTEEVEVGSSVNAIIALVAGFMVWAYPILAGINIEQQLSMFFMQGTIVTLVLIVVLMFTSMFLPSNLPKQLQEQFLKGNKVGIILIGSVIVGVIILVTSGLMNLIVGPIFTKIDLGNDTVLTVVVLGLLILPLIFIFKGGSIPDDGKEKKESD